MARGAMSRWGRHTPKVQWCTYFVPKYLPLLRWVPPSANGGQLQPRLRSWKKRAPVLQTLCIDIFYRLSIALPQLRTHVGT